MPGTISDGAKDSPTMWLDEQGGSPEVPPFPSLGVGNVNGQAGGYISAAPWPHR